MRAVRSVLSRLLISGSSCLCHGTGQGDGGVCDQKFCWNSTGMEVSVRGWGDGFPVRRIRGLGSYKETVPLLEGRLTDTAKLEECLIGTPYFSTRIRGVYPTYSMPYSFQPVQGEATL